MTTKLSIPLNESGKRTIVQAPKVQKGSETRSGERSTVSAPRPQK
ncbi:hypothetical protein BSG8_22620 [Bacillus subtilis subsp. natto]|nr:hypothetical protein BSG8_22620 [Bacillus subtilis subsp. natto]BEH06322.1 hypothetical protein BSNN_23550 [Bacillus subtilis subsp. natto]